VRDRPTQFLSALGLGLLLHACSSQTANGTGDARDAAARATRPDVSTDATPGDAGGPAHDASSTDAGCVTRAGAIPDAAFLASAVPRVNEISFYSALASSRPDLLAYPPDGGSGTGSLCYEAMILSPAYRAALLEGGSSILPNTLEVERASERTADESWIASQQADELAYCASHPGGGCYEICTSGACAACPDASVGDRTAPLAPYYASGYGVCAFVGYESGPDVAIYDANGLVWLVYFQFRSPDSNLTPALMHRYAEALACSGFQGDFKILTDPSLPQQERFQYNDLIVHGHSEHDAELAEAIGLEMFTSGDKTLLAATGRGLDVHNVLVGAYEQFLVWAEYLCAEHGDLSIVEARSSHAVPYTLYEE
jgi:hypothetical protein